MFFVIPIPRIRTRPAARPAPPPPAHFALSPTTPGGETALFQDHRIGFSHALPGWPQATVVPGGPGEPPADAMVQFWDFPMWLRYRVEAMHGPAPSAMHVALDYAGRYAAYRTRDPVTPQPASPDRVASWFVDAAAVASYPLAVPDPLGATHEDLHVLVRHGSILAITRRFAGADQDWVRHAAFRAAADATMIWDPHRYRYDAKVWPPSAFLEPMLPPVLLQGRQQAIPGIAASLQLSPTEGQALASVLEAMMRNDLAPWLPLPPDARDRWVHALGQAVPRPEIADLLLRGFAEVQTGQDLRGYGLMTGTALSGGGGGQTS
jgi:hypothetical protein